MKKKKKGFALLLEWAGKDKYYIYASVISAFLASLLSVIPYYGFYRIIELVSTAAESGNIARQVLLLAGFVFLTMVVKVAFGIASSLFSHKGAYHTLFKVRCMVTDHMAKMPLGALGERSTGEIKYVMNESIEKMELFLAHNLPELILYMTGPIFMFIYLLTVHTGLALLSVAPLLLVFIVIILMYMRFSRYMDTVNDVSASLSGAINEYVRGMRLIKAFHMGSSSFKKYKSAVDAQHKVWGQISKATGPFYACYVVLLESGILFLVPAGGYLFVHGHIAVGTLLLFAFVGTQYLTDIRPLQELANNLSFAGNGIRQVDQILEEPIFTGGQDFPDCHDIDICNVSFHYGKRETASENDISTTENPVLSHVNLHIAAGEKIAFVGASGAGKSTLMQLISRFYDVTDGQVRIGGVDVREINYEQMLSNISIVFQQSFLSRGSVYENIAMGSGASLEEVRQAARLAQIDDFIMTLPQQYDTKVGSYGGRFSGGEKQRICIARAILKNAPILILDEATSAADPENQLEIDRAIANLCKGKTVMIVAHRLGIAKKCDRIAVIENRKISGIGSFDEMARNNAYFRNAWQQYVKARNISYVMGVQKHEA